jgi:hypothetical protein
MHLRQQGMNQIYDRHRATRVRTGFCGEPDWSRAIIGLGVPVLLRDSQLWFRCDGRSRFSPAEQPPPPATVIEKTTETEEATETEGTKDNTPPKISFAPGILDPHTARSVLVRRLTSIERTVKAILASPNNLTKQAQNRKRLLRLLYLCDPRNPSIIREVDIYDGIGLGWHAAELHARLASTLDFDGRISGEDQLTSAIRALNTSVTEQSYVTAVAKIGKMAKTAITDITERLAKIDFDDWNRRDLPLNDFLIDLMFCYEAETGREVGTSHTADGVESGPLIGYILAHLEPLVHEAVENDAFESSWDRSRARLQSCHFLASEKLSVSALRGRIRRLMPRYIGLKRRREIDGRKTEQESGLRKE